MAFTFTVLSSHPTFFSHGSIIIVVISLQTKTTRHRHRHQLLFLLFSPSSSTTARSFGSGSSIFLLRTTPSIPKTARLAADEAEPAIIEEAPEKETAIEGEEMEEEEEEENPFVKLGDIMRILNQWAVEAGDVVEIKLEVPENRRRDSTYKGIVISKQNAGIHATIRIRRIIAGVGVEIVFPVYSPNIKQLKVVSHRKVGRAGLYYLRDKLPRLSTFK